MRFVVGYTQWFKTKSRGKEQEDRLGETRHRRGWRGVESDRGPSPFSYSRGAREIIRPFDDH